MIATAIHLSPAEIQSGHDRVRWAEGLILQLPQTHDGRNSWLLNYGTGAESDAIRAAHAKGVYYGGQFSEPAPITTTPVRGDYRLSDADFNRLLESGRPVPYLVANGSEPTSPRDAVLRIWQEIADREGVDVDSIRRGSDGNGHYTAIAKAVQS
jgi:hypothetical protein